MKVMFEWGEMGPWGEGMVPFSLVWIFYLLIYLSFPLHNKAENFLMVVRPLQRILQRTESKEQLLFLKP